jgi:hypothetical protein
MIDGPRAASGSAGVFKRPSSCRPMTSSCGGDPAGIALLDAARSVQRAIARRTDPMADGFLLEGDEAIQLLDAVDVRACGGPARGAPPERKEPIRTEAERVIPVVFDDRNLHLIGPDRTYRDGDTIDINVSYSRTTQGG